jgi:hypothetical protein
MNWKLMLGGLFVFVFLVLCYFLGGRMGEEQPARAGNTSSEEKPSLKNEKPSFAKGKRDKRTAGTTLPKEHVARKKPTVNLSTNSVKDDLEQKGLDALQLALDEENFAKVRAAAVLLARSPSPYVRGKVVEALRWFKQAAVADLRAMLGDSNEEVASDAQDGWLEAVTTITDDEMKAKELLEGMTQIQDLDSLREAAMQYYDIDDGLALQYSVPLIASGNPVAGQVGREIYEHITGEKYTTPQVAEQWITDWRREHPLEPATP